MPEPKLPLELVRCDPVGAAWSLRSRSAPAYGSRLDALRHLLVQKRDQPVDDREPPRDRLASRLHVGGLARRPRRRHRLQRRHAARRLRRQGSDLTLLGIDPSDVTRYAVAKGYEVINDFFSERTLAERFPNRKARIVTSIAMFYDLEHPGQFVEDIARMPRRRRHLGERVLVHADDARPSELRHDLPRAPRVLLAGRDRAVVRRARARGRSRRAQRRQRRQHQDLRPARRRS